MTEAIATTDHPPTKSVFTGLKFRWTLALGGFMLLMVMVGEVLIRVSTERLVSRQQAVACRDRAQALAMAARDGMRSGQPGALEQFSNSFKYDPSILFVEFYSPIGDRISGSSFSRQLTPPPFGLESGGPMFGETVDQPRLFSGFGDQPPFIDIVEPVLDRIATTIAPRLTDDVLGFVRIGIDMSASSKEVAAYMNNIRSAGLVAVLLIVPLSFIIVRRVSAPIEHLSRAVSRLAVGDFGVRSSISRSDEIGDLARAFNRMADELSSKTQSLVKLNEELEDRVQQRTRQLKELASKDPLTALYNRRHLSEVLGRRFSEAERYGTDLSCLMIDLDNFKDVNDLYGHEMGDHLLVLTAGVIQSELRGADVGARFGGDEFCVVLPQTSAEQAWQVGKRIVARFNREVKSELGDKKRDFGISVGVAGMQELKVHAVHDLMRAADQALYGAKESGKNRIFLAEALA